MTNLNIYSKEQIDVKIPDNTSASVGDVLAKGTNGNEWITPSGGGSGITAHTYSYQDDMELDIIQHPLAIIVFTSNNNTQTSATPDIRNIVFQVSNITFEEGSGILIEDISLSSVIDRSNALKIARIDLHYSSHISTVSVGIYTPGNSTAESTTNINVSNFKVYY